jgi:hypothetical protein
MLTSIWGKYGWSFIHLITMSYPEIPTEEDKMYYYEYFHALKHVLPCKKCRYNMNKHLNKYPLDDQSLASRKNLVKWGIDLHNIVNYYTGSPMLTYTEAMNELNKLVNPPNTNYTLYIILFVIIIALLYIIYRCKQ